MYELNPDKLEASYGTLIPLMVNAIKELNSKINCLTSENNTFKSEMEYLKLEIEKIKQNMV